MKNNYIIYMAFIAIILSSCKPEQKKVGDSYSYLSEEQLNKTPYFNNPAFDTLIFISNKGDTLIFAKVKSVSYFNVSSRNNDPEDDSRAYSEVRHNTYQTLKGNGKFEVRQELEIGSEIIITFNNNIFYAADHHIGWNGFPTFISNYEINNKSFNNVIIKYSPSYDTSGSSGFINQSSGLFYIIDKKINLNYLLNN